MPDQMQMMDMHRDDLTLLNKGSTTIIIEPVGSQQPSSFIQSTATTQASKTTFWARFPWMGILSLVAVVFCSTAQFTILMLGNMTSASTWANGRLAPNVLLSMLNAASNIALTVAVGQGIAISWWRRAIAGGTVADLHYSWSFSTSFLAILTKFRYFNLIALAGLMTKVSIVDGILYQRALITYTSVIDTPTNKTITTFAASTFPAQSVMGSFRDSDGLMSADLSSLASYWSSIGDGKNLLVDVDNCDGLSCKYGLEGAGFAIDCVTNESPVDYGIDARQAFARNDTSGYENLPIFTVNFTRSWPSTTKNYSSFTLEMLFPNGAGVAQLNGSCPISLSKMVCDIRPAILNYTLFYSNASSALKSNPLSYQGFDATWYGSVDRVSPHATGATSGYQMSYNCDRTLNETSHGWEYVGCYQWDPLWRQTKGVTVLRNIDIVEDFSPGATSILEGFFLTFKNYLSGQATLSYDGHGWAVDSNGMLATKFARFDTPKGYCNYTYQDPSAMVMEKINTFSLAVIQRTNLYAPQNASYVADLALRQSGFQYDHDPYSYDIAHPFTGVSSADLKCVQPYAIVYYKDIFYQHEIVYSSIAFVMTFVVVGCIALLYRKFWELDRPVTLGPFEIANAFRSPAFKRVHGGDVDHILHDMGEQKLVYGQTDPESGKAEFKLA